MKITVINGEISEREKLEYAALVAKKYDINRVRELTIKVDGDFVEIATSFFPTGFERIRRITGYLVGSLDRFNNGKLAEVSDRPPHGYDDDYYQHDFSGLLG